MTVMICGDIHVPYQDKAAVNVMLKMSQHFRPSHVILNGDIIDCVQLSRFTSEPMEPSSLKTHIEETCDIIKKLQRYSEIIYIEGNHEYRLEKYILENAPELHGLLSMESLINDNLDTDVQYVNNVPRDAMIQWRSDLIIGHFNVARKYSGYTSKALVEKFQTNVVQAHTHRLGEYHLRAHDKTLRGFESGCLCDINPSYVLKPNWQQGFLMYTGDENRWNIETVVIHDGEAMFRGKIYK